MILTLIVCFSASIFLSLPIIKRSIQITIIIIAIALSIATIFSWYISSWYAYLILLIYVGGILVIFAYFTATSPNQKFTSSKKILFTITIIFILTILISSNLDNPTLHISFNQELIRLFNLHNSYALILITVILFITIIIVVKLSSISKGPLRTFTK